MPPHLQRPGNGMIIPSDPDAHQPFKSDSPLSDPPPTYQDIVELSSRGARVQPNERAHNISDPDCLSLSQRDSPSPEPTPVYQEIPELSSPERAVSGPSENTDHLPLVGTNT